MQHGGNMPIKYSATEVMEMEKGGQLFYKTVATQSKDPDLKNLFLYLADEEKKHINVFVNIAKTLKVSPDDMPADWEEVSLYLKAMTDSRYFLGGDKALSAAKSAETTEQAVNTALAFEKETLVFYLEALDMMPAINRPAVEALIREERAHIRKLSGFLQSCQK
jgi:rubrerythrin